MKRNYLEAFIAYWFSNLTSSYPHTSPNTDLKLFSFTFLPRFHIPDDGSNADNPDEKSSQSKKLIRSKTYDYSARAETLRAKLGRGGF